MSLLRYVNPFGPDANQPPAWHLLRNLWLDPRLWFRCAYYRWYACHSPAYYHDWCNCCGESDPAIAEQLAKVKQ